MSARIVAAVGVVALLTLAARALAQPPAPPAVHMPLLADSRPSPLPTQQPTQAATATATATHTPTATATATPTTSPTATATPAPVTLLPNGDFEQGPGIAWAGDGITNTPPLTPHSGAHAAALAAAQTTGEITQAVTVPAGSPRLSYWVAIVSTEPTCGDDLGGVAVFAADGLTVLALDRLELCAATAHGWQRRSLDLSAHAGATVRVHLQAGTFDGPEAPNSTFVVDDVGWRAAP
jgi:hypothetical protein